MLNTHVKLSDLKLSGCIVYQAEIHPIAIYVDEDRIYAVDNR